MQRSNLCRACCAAIVMSLGLASVAMAMPHDGFPDPFLPPIHPNPAIAYYGQDLHAMYPQGVILNDPVHRDFVNVQRMTIGPDEMEWFDSTVYAKVDVPSMGISGMPVTLTGTVTTKMYNYVSGQLGTFDTEIVGMLLYGNLMGMPVFVRESPTLSSLGETSISAGNNYVIDSFFDVFTELSLDECHTWGADMNGPGRMELCPEPATAVLLALALAGLVVFRRRK